MKCYLYVHLYDSNHSRSMKKPIFMYIYKLALTMYVLVQCPTLCSFGILILITMFILSM